MESTITIPVLQQMRTNLAAELVRLRHTRRDHLETGLFREPMGRNEIGDAAGPIG